MNRAYKLSLLCGIAPLATGLSIFGAWLLTRRSWLEIAGILTICGGMAVVVIGAILLAVSIRWSLREGSAKSVVLMRALVAAGLMLSNFVAAAMVVWAVIYIETAFIVTVENRSKTPIETCQLEGGGVHVDFGRIAPGKTRKRSFYIRHDGRLDYLVRTQGKEVKGTAERYVTHGVRGNRLLIVQEDGEVIVQ